MPFTPIPARCRNCKKRFTKTQATKVFCSTKCRANFHNYGKTPLEQITKRLQVWMKTPEFRELMREAVRKEVQELLRARPPEGHPLSDR